MNSVLYTQHWSDIELNTCGLKLSIKAAEVLTNSQKQD